MNDLWGNKLEVGDFIRFPTSLTSNICQIKYAKILGFNPLPNRVSLKIRSVSCTEAVYNGLDHPYNWKLAQRDAVLERVGFVEKVKDLPLEIYNLFI
jgi:hypothetical protein